jgi:WD40 repeat protein
MGAARSLLVLVIVVFSSVVKLSAQTVPASATEGPCAIPVSGSTSSGKNLFNDQQEEWLGEIAEESMRKSFHLIADRDGYLQKIGERLLAQLPPTGIHYRFSIIDSPGLNSFGLAGGRIFIYRRMIASARNEDELAALLGHEIGHIIVHQLAMNTSAWFRAMGVSAVGDRQDVFNKWNQLRDTIATIKKKPSESHEDQEQLIADRIGLYAVTRAGYDPGQFATFLDRTLETKGKTGGFWSDLFGATSPESKRLREVLRNSRPLPPNCIAPRPDTSQFSSWQELILESKIEVAREQLPGLLRKIPLQLPLRNELTFLQFSQDGKYLLAQDDSSIFLLTREPLANLFRIDAPDAERAQFTPDSKSVVFYDKELRVQKWDIASQRQSSIHEITASCDYTELSPTGDVMGCAKFDKEMRNEVQLLDVNTGTVIYSREKFYQLTFNDLWIVELFEILGDTKPIHTFLSPNMAFSTDGRYFVAARGEYSLAYDLTAHSETKIPGKAKPLLRTSFIFTGPDEIFGVDGERSQKAFHIKFPGGEVLDQFPFAGRGKFTPAFQAKYVMVRPAGIATIGAVDLSAKKTTMGYKTAGFAIYDNFFAGDDVDGTLKLFRISDKATTGQVQLPNSPLARAKASEFSADGKWLAVSGRSRGALWKLENGQRIGFSSDFDGVFFDQDRMIAKYPGHLKDPAQVLAITPAPIATTKLYDLEPLNGDKDSDNDAASIARRSSTFQFEDLLFEVAPSSGKKAGSYTLDVRDVTSNTSLWQLQFEKRRPTFTYSKVGGTISFLYSNQDTIKEVAQHSPGLNEKLEQMDRRTRESLNLVEVCEARTHRMLGSVLVDTGNHSFRVTGAAAAGDTVIVADSRNRTLVYSLKSGQQKGKVFGRVMALSSDGKKMLVQNDPGIADVFDAATLESQVHFSFPSRISRAEFLKADDLMVLTADQTVYEFGVSGSHQNATASK